MFRKEPQTNTYEYQLVKFEDLYGVQKLKNDEVVCMLSRVGNEWDTFPDQMNFCWMPREKAERLFNFLTKENIEIIKKYP